MAVKPDLPPKYHTKIKVVAYSGEESSRGWATIPIDERHVDPQRFVFLHVIRPEHS